MSISPLGSRSGFQSNPAQRHQHDESLATSLPDTFLLQQSAHPVQAPSPSQQRALTNYLVQKTESARMPSAAPEREDALEHLRMLLIGCQFDRFQAHAAPEINQPVLQFGPKVVALLAAFGTGEDIKLCKDLGIDLNSYEGESPATPTPLFQAVAAGNSDTVQALLPLLKQRDLHQQNVFGETVLDIAKRRKDDSMVQSIKSAEGPFALLQRMVWNFKKELTTSSSQLSLGDPTDFSDEGSLLLS